MRISTIFTSGYGGGHDWDDDWYRRYEDHWSGWDRRCEDRCDWDRGCGHHGDRHLVSSHRQVVGGGFHSVERVGATAFTFQVGRLVTEPPSRCGLREPRQVLRDARPPQRRVGG